MVIIGMGRHETKRNSHWTYRCEGSELVFGSSTSVFPARRELEAFPRPFLPLPSLTVQSHRSLTNHRLQLHHQLQSLVVGL
jgi:hypothetical protein